MSANLIRIMLVDDHAVVRTGVKRLLEQKLNVEVIAEFDSGEQAYSAYADYQPDLVIIDFSMDGMSGLDAINRILSRHPKANFLVFSMYESAVFASQAIKAGAKGYVTKKEFDQDLVNAVTEIMAGRTYISRKIAQIIAMQSLVGNGNPIAELSAREFEVFRLYAEGNKSEEIADKLKISHKTVANYGTTIRQKLGVSTPVEIVRMAIRHGLIDY